MATRKKSAAPRMQKGSKSSTVKKRQGKLAPSAKTRGLDASQVAIAMDSPDVADLAKLVRDAGGIE